MAQEIRRRFQIIVKTFWLLIALEITLYVVLMLDQEIFF